MKLDEVKTIDKNNCDLRSEELTIFNFSRVACHIREQLEGNKMLKKGCISKGTLQLPLGSSAARWSEFYEIICLTAFFKNAIL